MTKKSLKDSRIGRQLGDYKIIEVLATGGMARIYRGKDVKLEREAAVKVLTAEMVESDAFLAERFVREAKAVAALDHPNIIPIYQYGEQDGLYFLVMKLIRGHDFADEIKEVVTRGEKMEVGRMIHILRQTATALDHAHKFGIIHRDVKPSNILVEAETGRAILTDFGLVLRQTDIDQTMGTAFGTPRYISPEQALASESAVPQSDVYSLAVIVYEILTGSQVFEADTVMQVALSHISEPPPRPTTINPNIPAAAEREILKALEKEPEKRHRTATEFIESVAAAYDQRDAGIGKKPPTPTIQFPNLRGDREKKPSPADERPKRRSGAGLLVGLTVAMLAVVLGLFVLLDINIPSVIGVGDGAIRSAGAGIQPQVVAVTLGERQPAEIYYNRQVWAIRNVSDAPLSLHQMRVTRGGAVGFDGTLLVNAQRLEPGECVIVQNAESRVNPPADWSCGNVRNQILRYSDGLFWRGESGTFRVQLSGASDVDCDLTDADGNGLTCAITLPSIVDESS